MPVVERRLQDIRVPVTSVDMIASGVYEGSAAAQCTTMSHPRMASRTARDVPDIARDGGDAIQLRVVERRDVERHDRVATVEQVANEVDAEETGASGDEDGATGVMSDAVMGCAIESHVGKSHHRSELRQHFGMHAIPIGSHDDVRHTVAAQRIDRFVRITFRRGEEPIDIPGALLRCRPHIVPFPTQGRRADRRRPPSGTARSADYEE